MDDQKKKNLPMDLMNYLDSIDILFHFVKKKQNQN